MAVSTSWSGSGAASDCKQGLDPFLVVLSREVAPQTPFRLLAVSEQPLSNIRLQNGQSEAVEIHDQPSSGPPYAKQFQSTAPDKPGDYPIRLVTANGTQSACAKVFVRSPKTIDPRPAPTNGIWQISHSWNNAWERVFSAWIAHLFRPLPNQPKGWKPLHQVLHQKRRNFLHNRLGHEEDDPKNTIHVSARADCGDAPYQLRAYFAWKFSLPFRFRRCSRGNSIKGPRCNSEFDNRTSAFNQVPHPVKRFNAFIKQSIAWKVHTGTMRTLPEDETSDFYPIALSRESIRPGTIFVDVGGHALIVTQWNSDGLYAIDGHPDRSVTRRRFSSRFFPHSPRTQTGGFKAFRPVEVHDNRIIPLPNSELTQFFSVEQYSFATRRAFYSQMSRLIDSKSLY
ncbi:MAG: hypothetical protein GY847_13550 [Proteobacteria bacterium]|nr:hypothetical protein [Pseudomonadota bacterium]